MFQDKISLKNGFWPQFFAMVVTKIRKFKLKGMLDIFAHFFLKRNSHSFANKLSFTLSTSKTFDLSI